MCYAKPGPRCSNHALNSLKEAKSDFFIFLTDQTESNFNREFVELTGINLYNKYREEEKAEFSTKLAYAHLNLYEGNFKKWAESMYSIEPSIDKQDYEFIGKKLHKEMIFEGDVHTEIARNYIDAMKDYLETPSGIKNLVRKFGNNHELVIKMKTNREHKIKEYYRVNKEKALSQKEESIVGKRERKDLNELEYNYRNHFSENKVKVKYEEEELENREQDEKEYSFYTDVDDKTREELVKENTFLSMNMMNSFFQRHGKNSYDYESFKETFPERGHYKITKTGKLSQRQSSEGASLVISEHNDSYSRIKLFLEHKQNIITTNPNESLLQRKPDDLRDDARFENKKLYTTSVNQKEMTLTIFNGIDDVNMNDKESRKLVLSIDSSIRKLNKVNTIIDNYKMSMINKVGMEDSNQDKINSELDPEIVTKAKTLKKEGKIFIEKQIKLLQQRTQTLNSVEGS